jgi:hypothetical protein
VCDRRGQSVDDGHPEPWWPVDAPGAAPGPRPKTAAALEAPARAALRPSRAVLPASTPRGGARPAGCSAPRGPSPRAWRRVAGRATRPAASAWRRWDAAGTPWAAAQSACGLRWCGARRPTPWCGPRRAGASREGGLRRPTARARRSGGDRGRQRWRRDCPTTCGRCKQCGWCGGRRGPRTSRSPTWHGVMIVLMTGCFTRCRRNGRGLETLSASRRYATRLTVLLIIRDYAAIICIIPSDMVIDSLRRIASLQTFVWCRRMSSRIVSPFRWFCLGRYRQQ